jgi:hypothetical protein
MTTIASASFVASYKTTVTFGRTITNSEVDQLNAVRTTAISAGRQCSTAINTDGTNVTYWASADDANSYTAVANAFSPAPTTACVVTAV